MQQKLIFDCQWVGWALHGNRADCSPVGFIQKSGTADTGARLQEGRARRLGHRARGGERDV